MLYRDSGRDIRPLCQSGLYLMSVGVSGGQSDPPGAYRSAGNPHSGPHSCPANVLPTEPSPQHVSRILLYIDQEGTSCDLWRTMVQAEEPDARRSPRV